MSDSHNSPTSPGFWSRHDRDEDDSPWFLHHVMRREGVLGFWRGDTFVAVTDDDGYWSSE